MNHRTLFSEFIDKKKGIPSIMGATAIIKYKNYYIFSLNNEKYWKKVEKQEIGFSGVGGRVEDNETPYKTVIREVKEEINENVSFEKSKETTYINQDGRQKKIISDDGPAFIAEFTAPGVPGDSTKPGRWGLLLFIYFGEINHEPKPTHDIPGIILVDKTNFNILYQDKISYDLFIKSGSRIKSHKKIPKNSLLVPSFSAKVISQFRINPEEYL